MHDHLEDIVDLDDINKENEDPGFVLRSRPFVLNSLLFRGPKKRSMFDISCNENLSPRKALLQIDHKAPAVRASIYGALGEFRQIGSDCINLILKYATNDLKDVHRLSMTCKYFHNALNQREGRVRLVCFKLQPSEISKHICHNLCFPKTQLDSDITHLFALHPHMTPTARSAFLDSVLFGTFFYIPQLLYNMFPEMNHDLRENSNKTVIQLMLQTFERFVREHNNSTAEIASMLCNYASGGIEIEKASAFYEVLLADRRNDEDALKAILQAVFLYLRDMLERFNFEISRNLNLDR